MTAPTGEEYVYRFAVYGLRGKVTLRADEVHIHSRAGFSWWEQTIPLEHLSPRYVTVVKSSPEYYTAWVFAIIAIVFGAIGLAGDPLHSAPSAVSAALLPFGLLGAWYLYRHRGAEFRVFVADDNGFNFNYARQGPDQDRFEEFTEQLVATIRRAKNERR